MRIAQRRFWIVILIVAVSIFGLTTRAYAGGTDFSPLYQTGQYRPTIVTIDQPEPFLLGDHPTIIVNLTTFTTREAIANQPIKIYVNDIQKATGYTDSNGVAYITLKYKFASGSYELRATFPGSPADDLEPSTDTKEMVFESSEAVIRTAPPIAGIRVSINDRIYTSDKDGVIQFEITESGMYQVEVLQIDESIFPSDVIVEFERWNDNVFVPEREVYFPRQRPLEIGFILNHAVSQNFYDSTGQLIDPSRITSISIGGVGRIYTFDGPGPFWLPSNRLVRRIGQRLESQQILYYVRNVSIDGVNVINRSEQRFYTRPQNTWPIEVLLYTIRFTGRDALFDFPIGSGIQIEYPNGQVKNFPFNDQAEVEIPSLARGRYDVSVIGARGSAPPIPVYLSRDQSVQLIVISYLDFAVIFGSPIILAIVLLFIGRPNLLITLRKLVNPKTIYRRIFDRNIAY